MTTSTLFNLLLTQLELENTPFASLQRGKNPCPTNILDMMLNNLMARFQ